MTRSFLPTPIPPDVLNSCVDLASRAPSAGKTQGWHLLALQGSDAVQYWDIALPEPQRSSFVFPHLLEAPLIMLSLSNRQAYLDRYSESDKQHTGLGDSVEAWPAPYWTIDASFATMTLLLALQDSGLSTLFFAHAKEQQLREKFSIPDHVEILGVIAAGYANETSLRRGRSAGRKRRTPNEIIHLGRW